MARVKRGFKARRRRNRVLKQTKGFTLGRKNKFKRAIETWRRGLRYAFRDRKAKKRDFRSLWNQRISAAAETNGTSYSRLIHALSKADIQLNRKMLADIAGEDPVAFTTICKQVA
jgi:large subunit ribosomal protein L20